MQITDLSSISNQYFLHNRSLNNNDKIDLFFNSKITQFVDKKHFSRDPHRVFYIFLQLKKVSNSTLLNYANIMSLTDALENRGQRLHECQGKYYELILSNSVIKCKFSAQGQILFL